tara:strand:- start:2383 stop:3822 length:1440 start_codon:yes stop_codon:yes gene_type:complete
MPKVIPVILCGGKGSRLWPLSRQSYPKQFLDLYGNNSKSLLQQTQERINFLNDLSNPIIICNEEHRFLVAEQMRNIAISPKAIILETEGKNTAPAVALAAIKALEEDSEDSLLLILSADHIIKDLNLFEKVIKKGCKFAQEDNLVTFGVIPTRPETGYGYIESEVVMKKNIITASKIKRFVEKPDKELAQQFLKSKKFTWNSGMFIFKTCTILRELGKYAPEVLNNCQESIRKSQNDLDFVRIDKKSFSKCPNIPIDIAVMEKTNSGLVISLDAGWSDIGSWQSLWDNEEKDDFGNVIKGKVFSEGSKDCYLKSENRLLVTIGLKDIVLVETSDAILAAKKSELDKIKIVLSKLNNKGFKEITTHRKIYRPWGSYTSLIENQKWLVKSIEVNPESKLSLQMHHHRAEHWIVVKGTAKVEIDNKSFVLTENQSTFIPVGAKHRLSNPGKILLTIIEIQSGDYIGEDDIVRFEDVYGRVKS